MRTKSRNREFPGFAVVDWQVHGARGLLQNFILPNFYFHCTTAYDILRHCGSSLSKRDDLPRKARLSKPLGQKLAYVRT